jgi:sugar phosphate isomerase/epimerase
MVLKQHHGLNNTPLELLGWMEQVNHPNFRLFFDPGNLVYYTGKNPVTQLDLILPHVVGLIAKDCTGPQYQERRSGDPAFGTHRPNPHGDEVMIQFGTGVVDLAGIVKKLKAAGFAGTVMVEGLAVGSSPSETIANARANREYFERISVS